jgi:hypothetical protein
VKVIEHRGRVTHASGPRSFVPPRWGTQRNPERETIGAEIADVAERLGVPPMPHQRYVFDVAGELDPDTGDLWYTESNTWVMRQCGKTMGICFPVIVHRCTRMPRRIGARQRASFTMQDRQETRKKFELDMIPQLVDAAESFRRITNPKGRPGRSTREWRSSLNNGSEHLQFGQGNYMLIDTPSEKAGHGGTLDLKVADEVRFGVDDRIEASAGPSQITRRSRQLWVASTAGDEKSFYMWPKVLAGRQRIERGDTDTRVCSFEWSVPEDADLHDPDVWYEFHPATGHTIQVADILDELRKAEDHPDESKLDTFRQEYANQWVRTPVLGDGPRERVIGAELWASRTVPEGTVLVGDVALAVDVSPEGRSASITIAGRTADGTPVVDVVAFDAGTFWLEQRIASMRDAWGPKVIGYGPGAAAALAPEIGRAAGTVPVKALPAGEYAAGCEAFVISLVEDRVRHLGQAWLTSAVDGASRLMRGNGWLWDRQTALTDITPLVGATVALRLLEMVPSDRPPAPLSQIF